MKSSYHTIPVIRNFFLAVLMMMLLTGKCTAQESDVIKAVKGQLEMYPASTLQDIYKSFFQDEYGPGHLVGDTAGARNYLDWELNEMESRGNYNAEPCGTGRNFYRVPLDLVKDGVIPFDQYFEAFMESAGSFRTPDIDEWKVKWHDIVREIESIDLQLPNFDSDRKALEKMLDEGEVVVHHSSSFNELYHPHYRILGVEQWNKLKEAIAGQ